MSICTVECLFVYEQCLPRQNDTDDTLLTDERAKQTGFHWRQKQRSVCMSALKSHLGTVTRGIYSFRVVLIRSRMSGSNLRKGADLRSESSTLYRSLEWNKILSVIKVFFFNHLHLWWKTNCNGTIYKNHVNLMLKIRPLFIS